MSDLITHPGCQWKVQVLSVVFWVKDVLFFCHPGDKPASWLMDANKISVMSFVFLCSRNPCLAG